MQCFGPVSYEGDIPQKIFLLCRNFFPQLSKSQLRACFLNREVFVDELPVRGAEDESRRISSGSVISITRDSEAYKRKQILAIQMKICSHNTAKGFVIPLKPAGVNAASGRLFDEAIKLSLHMSQGGDQRGAAAEATSLFSLYRLPKNTGGLCVYGTSPSSLLSLRHLLCQNVLEVSFVCLVVGNAQSSDIPLPVSFSGSQEDEGEEEEEEEEEGASKCTEKPEEKYCVMHSLRVEVLQTSSGHHIGSLSLIRVTPVFLPVYATQELRALLRPSTKEEYQYVHYPISVIKAIPKALRLSGSSIIGGDRGLVKTSKGLFFFLDQIRFLNSVPETISVPIPDKFIKLLNSKPNKDPSTREEESVPQRVTFSGLLFDVSSAVMTPRPASETLVRQALAIARQRAITASASGSLSALSPIRVLDLGTGSGSLLLACLHSLQQDDIPCSGVGIDISPMALAVAQRNANHLSLSHLTRFLQHSFTDLATLATALQLPSRPPPPLCLLLITLISSSATLLTPPSKRIASRIHAVSTSQRSHSLLTLRSRL
jgi:hypothetical protein